jgi:DNA-binding NtrC family response regulator
MMRGKILVVDDEKDMLALLERIISEKTDYDVAVEHDPLAAAQRVKHETFHVVITDLKMPKMDGIALLEEVLGAQPTASVIIMTAYGTIDTAVDATKKGAFDYLTKPFRKERILLTVQRAMDWHALRQENVALRESLAHRQTFSAIVGSSPAIKSILDQIEQVAGSTATILIQGESGTGKELVARAIHSGSHRKSNPLVIVNCTAMPEQIIESELFGHKKGAFTGAWQDKKGLVDEANGGTLFLDEIGELNMVMQAKLLRLLQEGEYKPVGGLTTKQADIRFLAATNHDLKELIIQRRFREDLYYRLNVICFQLPALRDRKEDIPLLAEHFIRKYSRLNDKKIENITPEAMAMLMVRSWPGNIRELENTMERAVILCRSHQITLQDIITDAAPARPLPAFTEDIFRLPFKEAKEEIIKSFHRQYIQAVLQQSKGNISLAAEKAGLQRQYLHRIIKNEDIDAEQFKYKNLV